MSLQEQIDKAFDYRGDVTLDLKNGQQIEGFIFNRDHSKQTLTLFAKGETAPKPLVYADITNIRFTGEDTAAGGSWEEWKRKHGKNDKS